MTDLSQWFERQAQWQKSRSRLSWAEKLELAETLRETALEFRRSAARRLSGREVREPRDSRYG